MADFFDYEAPQYVSAFSPLNLNIISQGLQQRQQGAYQTDALLGDMYSKMYDIETQDPLDKQEIMSNLQEAANQVLTDAGGDPSLATRGMMRLASMARKDPWFRLNELKNTAVKEQNRIVANMKASGKTPYMFTDVSDIQLLDQGYYADPSTITHDVIPYPETDIRIRQIWKDYLGEEGWESLLNSSNIAGIMASTTWRGINEQQVLDDLNIVLSDYKKSDEYRLEKRIAEDKAKKTGIKFDEVKFDSDLKDAILESGKAMTADKFGIQYTQDPGFMPGGGGDYPEQLTEPTGFWASHKNFNKYDVNDLLTIKEGDVDEAFKTQALSYVLADNALRGSINTYTRQAKSVFQKLLSDGKITDEHITDLPVVSRLLDGETIPYSEFNELEGEVEALASKLGDFGGTGDPRDVTSKVTERDKSISTILRGVNRQLEGVYTTMKDRYNTMKENENDFMVPTYGAHVATGDNTAPKNLQEGVQRVISRIQSNMLFNEDTGKLLSDDDVSGSDVTWKAVIPDPFSNTIKVRADIKLTDDTVLLDQTITIRNEVDARNLIEAFDAESNDALTNALDDIYFVDRSNGNLINKQTSEPLELNAGYKARRNIKKRNKQIVGIEYTVDKTDGNKITYKEHFDSIYAAMKKTNPAAAEAFLKSVEGFEDMNKPYFFTNTGEIALYYGKTQ